MAANTSPIFELVPLIKGVTILPADTTTKKDLVTDAVIPTSGCRIDQINITSDDTSTVNVTFWLNDGSTDYHIGNVPVIASSGYLAVAKVDAILTLAPTLGYLFIPDGFTLKCSAVATVTAAKTVTVVAMGGKFE